MASGPITSWEIDWQPVETVSDFIFGGSKITADGDCSHEIFLSRFGITKIMASGPITSWRIDGEPVETVSDFIFGGLKNHCGW